MQRMDSPPHQQILGELAAAEKQNPADPDIFDIRGKTLADMKQYGQAIAAFRRAIELRPLDPSPYYQLGLLYRKTGDAALAREMIASNTCSPRRSVKIPESKERSALRNLVR